MLVEKIVTTFLSIGFIKVRWIFKSSSKAVGELKWLLTESIKTFETSLFASGGLDKAQDNKLVKHELELEALDDRISDVELIEKMLNKYSLKRNFFREF